MLCVNTVAPPSELQLLCACVRVCMRARARARVCVCVCVCVCRRAALYILVDLCNVTSRNLQGLYKQKSFPYQVPHHIMPIYSFDPLSQTGFRMKTDDIVLDKTFPFIGNILCYIHYPFSVFLHFHVRMSRCI